MSFLCDTNVLGELARPRPNAGVLKWARQLDELTVSAITIDEVYFGLHWKANERVKQWFDAFFE